MCFYMRATIEQLLHGADPGPDPDRYSGPHPSSALNPDPIPSLVRTQPLTLNIACSRPSTSPSWSRCLLSAPALRAAAGRPAHWRRPSCGGARRPASPCARGWPTARRAPPATGGPPPGHLGPTTRRAGITVREFHAESVPVGGSQASRRAGIEVNHGGCSRRSIVS